MNNYLSLVISKIQYAVIPESRFKSGVSTIQDELRKEYPYLSSRSEVQLVDMHINAISGEQSVNTKVIPRMCMASADRQWIIQIMPDNIMLMTTDYSGFAEFTKRMERLLNITQQTLDITHTSFIGVRYINKISILDDYHLIRSPEYLQPELCGYTKGGSNLTAKYETENGWLNINSGVLIDAPKLVPELQEMISEWQVDNQVLEGPWAHIDIDSFNASQELIEYNSSNIMDKLGRLRKHAKDSFSSIIIS
ncbi:TIGR04255 family protein [Photobacterium damselae]|uniref:TIGR04255 family protein n=1 Tax=Photobacterium damselae TaxID=38293 RepID=UPI004068B891